MELARFIRYLLTQSRTGRAVAELLALDADLPGDPDTQVALGLLFLEADDPTRAAVRFERVLRDDPGDLDARLGAGQARFALGDYAGALRYLSGPVARAGEGARLRRVAELVAARDPAGAAARGAGTGTTRLGDRDRPEGGARPVSCGRGGDRHRRPVDAAAAPRAV